MTVRIKKVSIPNPKNKVETQKSNAVERGLRPNRGKKYFSA
jgi:hypothetical protein